MDVVNVDVFVNVSTYRIHLIGIQPILGLSWERSDDLLTLVGGGNTLDAVPCRVLTILLF